MHGMVETWEMMMIPEVLVCPISLDLLSDPVTLPTTGHTYDRHNILRWFAAGHRTCPVTMETLPDRLLVPNRTLKHLIDRCCLLTSTASAWASAFSDLALPVLRDNLVVAPSPPPNTNTDTVIIVETLRIVRSLSPTGFCALLLRLLLNRNDDEDEYQQRGEGDAVVEELAVDCLVASPSIHELASALHQEALRTNKLFALLLRHGSPKVKKGLCRLIHMVAVTQPSSCTLSEAVMAALVHHVQQQQQDTLDAAALRAVASLCWSDQVSRETAVAAGVIHALVSYTSSGGGGRELLALALQTLELVLLSVEAGRQAMYSHPTATATLVMMVFNLSCFHVSEHAVGSLLVACRGSAMVRLDAINAGLLTQLLLLLQSHFCSPKGKANATALLKLLTTMYTSHIT